MIKRIPLTALQKALYGLLTEKQIAPITPVYDEVPEDAVLPYITLGAFTCKPNGAKGNTDISDVSLQLHIWSEYSGKLEVNGIAEDIITIIENFKIDLSVSNFEVTSQAYDMFEAFPEEIAGYHGVVTFVAKIQNLGA
jgi:hypothetical protein